MNRLFKSNDPPSFTQIFLVHFTRNLIIGGTLTLLILLVGMMGYRHYEKTEWLDAYVNSAMIISGVGTLTNPTTADGKLFVATYALIGGGLYLLVVGVVFSPIFHWLSRQVRLEDRERF